MQRRYRLRHSSDFELLRRSNLRWHDALVVLVINPNGSPFSRFAFVASKKVGKATRRNRARRLMREVVREHLDSIKPGWDCLLIAKKKTAEAQYRDVEDAILGLLKQGKLLVTTESRD